MLRTLTKVALGIAVTLAGTTVVLQRTAQTTGAQQVLASKHLTTRMVAGSSHHQQKPTPSATSATLATSANPAKAGLGVTITAAVTSPGSPYGTPGGQVSLMDGTTKLDQKWLNRTDGTATFSNVILAAGTHTLSAVYTGDWHFAPSTSAQLVQTIVANTYVGALPFAFYPGTISDKTNVTKLAQEYAATPAAGISWRFRWSDLEPASGTYDWTAMDNAISAAEAVHMPVIVRVIAGLYSPSWALSQMQTVSVPNVYFPNTGPYPTVATLPAPWSSGYLSSWGSFIQAFGARYNGNSEIYLVELSGGGDIGDMYLPPDMSQWNAVGYSDSALQSAWQTIITDFATAFPTTPVGLNITEPLICSAVSQGFNNTTCSPSWRSNVLAPLANWVSATYPGHVWMQNNGLKPKYADNIFLTRQILRAASQTSTVGYQLNGVMTSTSDLYACFAVARADEASYVEVYPDNLTNPADAQDLAFLRNG